MNIEQVEKTLNYLLDNNLKLVEQGLDKISVNLCGNAGIAKTSIVKQLAEKRNAKYVRINLAELEEIGDLVGIPQKEYLMEKDGDERWVTEKTVQQYSSMGYTLCPHCLPRMSYAIPAWVPDGDDEVVVCLDDFLRGSPLFQQAIMSLIQFGEYISWRLPKKAQLILTSNPSDNYNNMSELDSAQQSRMLTLNVEFDVNCWAKWAEDKLRGEFINFALYSPEIFERSHVINSRSYTLFANALSSISDLSSIDAMELAHLLAMGSFGENGEYVSGLYVQFINNKLDKLPSPKEILEGDYEPLIKSLKGALYTSGDYRADIGGLITIRLINYIANHIPSVEDKAKYKKLSERLLKLISYSEDNYPFLLADDLVTKLMQTINSIYPNVGKELMSNSIIRKKISII